MSLGSRGRRAARGLVLSVVLVSAGCRGLPVRRPRPEPAGPSVAPAVAFTSSDQGPGAATGPVGPLPPLPSQPKPDGEPPPAAIPVSATPMLDAALARAEEVTRAVVDQPDEPASVEPAPEADEPGPIPVDLIPVRPTAPEPSEPEPVGLAEPLDVEEPTSDERKETSGADKPETKTESEALADARDPWDASLERLRDLAGDRAGQGGDAAPAWDRRHRLLTWMAEARDGTEGSGPWNVLLSVLTDASAAPVPDLHAAALALEQGAPLEILDLRLCRRVLGFGDYEPCDADDLRAGQSVILYCELAGLRCEPAGDRVRSRLSSAVEVVPEAGGEPVWSCTLGTADDLCRHRRRDYYANYRIPLPESLAPGSYQLRLIQTDAIAGRSTSRSLPFTIRP